MKSLFTIVALSMLFSSVGVALSLEEQVGQILIPYIDGETVDETTLEFLRTHRPGGVILYNWSNKLDSPEQVKALSFGLQEQASELGLAPLFIAADQEGGLVARLRAGFTDFPGNAALGRADSEELAFLSAREMGFEMLDVGVNFTFAPVVDVNSNPDNPVIGIRSYGDNPELVSRLGLAASQGFSVAGFISCLKHFPGHGDVDVDSHESLPVLKKLRQDLDALELVPFRRILNDSPAIMTAHLRIPDLDAEHCATLSKTILTDLLRDELGYEGLIVSDSLTMGAILEDCGDIGEAAVQAFVAGNDLLVIGGRTLNNSEDPIHDKDLTCIREALMKAVQDGRISTQRLQESVNRIIQTKIYFNLWKPAPMNGDRRLAEDCSYETAEKAVRLEKGAYSGELWDQNVAVIAPQLLEEAIEASGLSQLGRACQSFYFEGLAPTPEEVQELEGSLEQVDAIIFVSYNAWRFAAQESLLRDLSNRYPVTHIAARDARDAELDTAAISTTTTVSPSATALQVVHDHLIRAAVKRDISAEEIEAIGMKIWQNECHQRIDQLIYWKEGEQWPSVGIGHFIWPPESYNGTFRDGRFHHVLAFLGERGVVLPKWLVNRRYSPWNTEGEFRARENSAEMNELLELLVSTVPLQAQYLVERFWDSVPKLLRDLSAEEHYHVMAQIQRISKEPGGLFALIDYLNFKHEGTARNEEYNGTRWGLKQVLLGIAETDDPLGDLVTSAKYRLVSRVAASPQERNEVRWIPGWFARLDRYTL